MLCVLTISNVVNNNNNYYKATLGPHFAPKCGERNNPVFNYKKKIIVHYHLAHMYHHQHGT